MLNTLTAPNSISGRRLRHRSRYPAAIMPLSGCRIDHRRSSLRSAPVHSPLPSGQVLDRSRVQHRHLHVLPFDTSQASGVDRLTPRFDLIFWIFCPSYFVLVLVLVLILVLVVAVVLDGSSVLPVAVALRHLRVLSTTCQLSSTSDCETSDAALAESTRQPRR